MLLNISFILWGSTVLRVKMSWLFEAVGVEPDDVVFCCFSPT